MSAPNEKRNRNRTLIVNPMTLKTFHAPINDAKPMSTNATNKLKAMGHGSQYPGQSVNSG